MRKREGTVLLLILFCLFFLFVRGEAQEEKSSTSEAKKPSAEAQKPETKKTRAKPKKAAGEAKKPSPEAKKPEAEAKELGTELKEPGTEVKKPGAEPKKAEAKKPSPETKKSGSDTKKSNAEGGFGGFGLASSRAPVDITSDTVEANNRQSIVIFKGNVVAKQEEITVYAGVMTVYYDSETKKVKEIVAAGNVKIVQLEKRATGQKATFYQNENKVVLEGDAVVREGDNVVRGDRVTYYSDEDKTIVEGAKGGGRVSTRITPSQKEQGTEAGKQKTKEKSDQ
jgi:lipopolysaccharide export system protein LptA